MAEKKMLSDYPHLVNEWNYEKNFGLNISDFTHGSNQEVWWMCAKQHEWKNRIFKRAIGNRGCPYCANKKVLRGFNDAASTYPLILNYWDFKKNSIDLYSVTSSSRKIAFFKCDKGHEWETKITNFVKNTNKCLTCAGITVSNKNSLKDNASHLIREWRGIENSNLTPDNVSIGSSRIVLWQCSLNHPLWRARIVDRVEGKHNCPYCSNHKLLEGYNTLADTHPELVKEWDEQKNNLKPTKVSLGSDYSAWWKCLKKNHSFQSSVKSRTYYGSNCSVCSHRVIIPYMNDVLTEYPEVLERIDSSLTSIDTLRYVSFGSNMEVWWKCQTGHSWNMSIKSVLRGANCSICFKQSSKMEIELSDFIETITKSINIQVLRNNRKIITPHELDIYIPEKKIAIEFNGLYWHSEAAGKDKNYHFNKWKKCQEQGIQLITIWEDDWRDNREVVESMLKYKLGLSNEKKVYARKTFVKEVSSIEAEAFLNQHHIQGFKNITKNYGLFSRDSNELVAVMSFSINKNVASLDRYATSCSVVGGFTKLLKYAVVEMKKDNSEVDSVITFADNEISDGGLYKNNGFVADSYIKPDYKYIYKNRRYHKFLFRKKRFKNDPELLFDENMTERELADLNNIHRVWDCGKTKYVKKI